MDKIKQELELDDYVYEFYEKLARKSKKSVKSVMEESLFFFAGFVSLKVIKKDGEK